MSENLSQRLKRKLQSPNLETKKQALFGIVEHDLAELGDDILRLLRDEKDVSIKGRCAWALGRLHHNAAFNALVEGLRSEDRGIRIWSAWALGELADDRAGGTLIDAFDAELEPKVRRAIGGALKKLSLEPTGVYAGQLRKKLNPPQSSDPAIGAIVKKLETLRWEQSRQEMLALRKQILDRDPEYFKTYMEWLKRKPALLAALANRKKVYSD